MLFKTGQSRNKFFRYDSRFQGTEADSFNSLDFIQTGDKTQKIFPLFLRKIDAVGTEMDSGKNNFFIPGRRKSFHLLHHIPYRPASHPATGIWDDAIVAKTGCDRPAL